MHDCLRNTKVHLLKNKFRFTLTYKYKYLFFTFPLNLVINQLNIFFLINYPLFISCV